MTTVYIHGMHPLHPVAAYKFGSGLFPDWLHRAFQSGEAEYFGGENPIIALRFPNQKARVEHGDWITKSADGELFAVKQKELA